MPMHFTVSAQCSDCNAIVTYTDERPQWKHEPWPAGARQRLAEAAEWVAANPVYTLGESHPAYVAGDRVGMVTWASYVIQPPKLYYVPCPSCGGRAYRGTVPAAAATDTESEARGVTRR